MPLFTSQEKLVIRFIIISVFIGLLVGAIRHRINQSKAMIKDDTIESFELLSDSIQYYPGTVVAEQDINEKEKTSKQSLEIININQASKEELITLPNVGPVTAERIIRYREDFGRFQSIEDLTKIKGVGPKTLDKIRPLITI